MEDEKENENVSTCFELNKREDSNGLLVQRLN